MRYIDARKLIRTGDILTCAGTAFYSKVIRIVTRSPITHVGIAIWIRFPDENVDRLAILESHAMKGVRLAPLSEVLKNDYWKHGGKVYWQSIADSRIAGTNVAANALKRWSKSYASWYQFLVLGSFTIKTIRYLLNKPMDSDPNGQHCSELVTRALIEAGYKNGNDPSITTPADVSNFSCLGDQIELEPCGEFNEKVKLPPYLESGESTDGTTDQRTEVQSSDNL